MNLLGKAADPKFWETVRNDEFYSEYRNELLSVWDELCKGKDFPDLPYSKYKLFWATGDRKIYEKPYFDRRRVLNVSAVLSLIYPDVEKYFVKLQDIIFEICNEYSWCLPAHQQILEKNDSVVVDLFASETGFSLAEIYTLHKKRLEPLLLARIKQEIKRRLIDSSLKGEEAWFWKDYKNNWLAICSGCIGCTTMLLFPKKFEKLKARIDDCMEEYIDSFLGEGVCLEGCSYWDYGFGFFTVYADMLKRYTDGEEDYFERADVKAIASFPQNMFLTENLVANFSDAFEKFNHSSGIIQYLKSCYPDAVKLPKAEYRSNGVYGSRFAYILRAATWADEKYRDFNEVESSSNYYYAPKSQWYVNKTSQYAFAAKGGHNKEPHNHNDIGSFIFAKQGRQIFTDLGSGVYTKDYFSTRRYEIFEPSSFSHSIPIIDGEGQLFGAEYAAKVIEANESVFTLDIGGAYGSENINSIVRCFNISLDKISMTDSFDVKKDLAITERFVTRAEPSLTENGKIEVDGVTLIFGDEVESCHIEKKVTENHECYLIDLALKLGATKFSCEIK